MIVVLDQSIKTLISHFFNLYRISHSSLVILWWIVEVFTRILPIILVQSSLLLPTTDDPTNKSTIQFPPLLLVLYGTFVLIFILAQSIAKYNRDNNSEKDANKIPFFSEYRSCMMLATCAAILAVDFPILFPRRIAKTETFGSSLMDLGVGSFVFSGALVSPSARGRNNESSSLIKIVRQNVPLFFLAASRFISVMATGYQTHVGEYGKHWNFFMTLMLVSVTVNVLDLIWVKGSIQTYLIAGIIITLAQQFLLSLGMQQYIEDAPRIGLISDNKEGICSVLGYVAIYYFAVAMGRVIFEMHTKALQSNKDVANALWKAFCSKMTTLSVILVTISYITFMLFIKYDAPLNIDRKLLDLSGFATFSHEVPEFVAGKGNDLLTVLANILLPSRQMVNLGYILWTVAYNVMLLTWFALLYSYILPTAKFDHNARFSVIREAVNVNQLATFLIANLLTGVINLIFKTVLWDNAILSGGLVFVYMQVVTIIMVSIYLKKWVIKL